MKKIAVIGAGISGLTCAYELQQAGYDVTVFEKEDAVGGRMATRIQDGWHFDIGANHLCDLYTEMKKYCKEFGVEWEKMRFEGYGVFRDGQILTQENVLSKKSNIKLAAEFLKHRKAQTDIFDLSSTSKYDDDNAYEYMRQNVGQDAADYLADAFVRTYQLHSAQEMSRGPLVAFMNSVANHHKEWKLHRTQGGMSALPEAFAQRLKVKLNTPVIKVVSKDHSIEVTTETTEMFDMVVLASPGTVTKKIYENPSDPQRALLDAVKYSTTIGMSFKVPKRTLGDLSIVWVPYVENEKISVYSNEEMKGDETTQDGKTLTCLCLHEEYANEIINLADEEIFETIKKEYPKVCPLVSEDTLEPYDIQRWYDCIPKYYQGYITQVKAFLEHGQGDNNIFFCGDYLASLWTEGSLRCGQQVAQEALKRQ